MGKKVLVPIADGTEEIEATTIIDCLRRADADVTVAAVDNVNITASRGVNMTADTTISDCINQSFDAIVLPGGMPGAEHLRDCQILINMLKQQKATGKIYAAICASPAVVLATHELIDDKNTTCYPSMIGQLPKGIDERVVVDGNCITSQGPATAMDFALALIEALYDADKRNNIAKALLVK